MLVVWIAGFMAIGFSVFVALGILVEEIDLNRQRLLQGFKTRRLGKQRIGHRFVEFN